MSQIDIQKARAAKHYALSLKDRFPFINGIGLSFDKETGYFLVVYLRESLPDESLLPLSIMDVPIKSEIIGPVSFYE
jgi:hypothetical protein